MEQIPFDTQIHDLHEKIDDLQKQMETISKQFIDATAAPVAAWYKQQIETLVKKDPNHLAALNPDQVKLVKADLQKLMDGAAAIVRTNLDKDMCWIHRRPVTFPEHPHTGQSYYHPSEISSPQHAHDMKDEAFRRIMGETYSILTTHGFTRNMDGYRTNTRPVQFLCQFPYSQEMKTIGSQYYDLEKQYIEAHQTLSKAEKEKLQFNANRLWDSN
jgi:hypothetical protein